MAELRFFFDVVCPYAYLASTRVERIGSATGARLIWKPMLLGGVFASIGRSDAPLAPAKARMNLLDQQRWAAALGVPLRQPAEHPRRSVEAMRLVTAATNAGVGPAVAHALFRAYWAEGRDISDRAVLGAIAAAEGLDLAAIDRQEIKDQLRATTDEAVREGVFGAPSFVVLADGAERGGSGRRFFWGQDRLGFVERALRGGGLAEPPATAAPAPPTTGAEVTFFFDFSSPFTYLGSTQIERVAAAQGARVRFHPIFLGALFKDLGGPPVPLLEMSEPRRRYLRQDLDDWAEHWGVPFRFPSRFPMMTVTALRMCLLADGERLPSLVRALFHAYWADDRDLADRAVLVDVAGAAGLDGAALVAATADPAVKQRLVDNTSHALRAGVFGLPSFLVGDELFFGQDRLDFVARALAAAGRAGLTSPSSV